MLMVIIRIEPSIVIAHSKGVLIKQRNTQPERCMYQHTKTQENPNNNKRQYDYLQGIITPSLMNPKVIK